LLPRRLLVQARRKDLTILPIVKGIIKQNVQEVFE
jgi:hypothetical protein